MERHLAYEEDAESFREQWLPKERELSQQITEARKILPEVQYSSKNMVDIANLSTSLQVDGHRSDLVILKTARAHAALEGRKAITGRDIALAAELAYPHRIKRGPFQQSEVSAEELSEKIEELAGGSADGESEVGEGGEQSDAEVTENGDKKKQS
jgi:Mg-chelatase subunit ChlI